jgi:hypothetical protein
MDGIPEPNIVSCYACHAPNAEVEALAELRRAPLAGGVDTSGKSLPPWHHRKTQIARAGHTGSGLFREFQRSGVLSAAAFSQSLVPTIAGVLP